MMTGQLYIDGKDAYQEYGVYVAEGGWNELIAMPPLKSPDNNDWQEVDGLEVDLSAPRLDSRTVQIKFAVNNGLNGYFRLIRHLSDGSYHQFDCTQIERNYKLRLVGIQGMNVVNVLGIVTLKFSDDFYSATPLLKHLPDNEEGYKIDGYDLSEYGITVLKGSLSEVSKIAEVKSNMTRNLSTLHGVVYDPHNVTYKSKDVTLKCLMRAETLEDLWRKYDGLLFDLIQPNERFLWVGELRKPFPCHYKQMTVSEFFPNDKIWLKFDLTLTFIRDFRITQISNN